MPGSADIIEKLSVQDMFILLEALSSLLSFPRGAFHHRLICMFLRVCTCLFGNAEGH